ncbi:MAG: YHS domain-containing protein [Deltaproteobacteria bacterium]|nr:YHS domain-containing protein [Deltaproteobacteria bacterium]MBW2083950.1 YHS domain-containing protein [Deltaproteobacteria bacterium]
MRLIILAILLYLLYRVVKNYLTRAKGLNHQSRTSEISDMVQDPVCKTFISAREAETRVIGGRIYHFCSKQCAERFEIEQGRKK